MQPILQNGKQYACRDGHNNDDYDDCIETTSGSTVVVNSLLCFISNFRQERNISEIISTYFHADSLELAKRILIELTDDLSGDSETAFQQKKSHNQHQNGIALEQAKKRRKCIVSAVLPPTTMANGVDAADGCGVNADDNLIGEVFSLYDRFSAYVAHWHRRPRFVTDDLTALPLMLPATDDAVGNNNKNGTTIFNGNDNGIISGTEDVLCEIRQIRYYLQNITSSSSAASQQHNNNNNNCSSANNNNNTKCLKCVVDLNDDDVLATDGTHETKRISNGRSKRRARLHNSPTLSCRSNDGEAKINLKFCEKTPKADTISSAGNSVSPMSSTIADDDIESRDIINSSTCQIVTRPPSPSLQPFVVSSASSLLTPMKSHTKNISTNYTSNGVSLLSCSSSTSSALSHCCVSSNASSAISSPQSLLSSVTKRENNINNNCASLSSPNSVTTTGNRLDRAVRKLTNRLEARLDQDHSVVGDIHAATLLTPSKTTSDNMKSSLLCFNDNLTKAIPPLTQLTFESENVVASATTTNAVTQSAPTTTTTTPTISNVIDPMAYMQLWKNFTAAAALATMASTKPNNNINALGHFASLPALATLFGNRLERTKTRCANNNGIDRKVSDETVDNLTKCVDERNAKFVSGYGGPTEPDDDADDEEEEEEEGEEEEEVNICVVDGNDAPNAEERVSSVVSSSRASPPFSSTAATAAAAAAMASFLSSVSGGRKSGPPMGIIKKPEVLKTESNSNSNYFADVQHGNDALKESTTTPTSTRYVRSDREPTMSSSSSSDDISDDDNGGANNEFMVASTDDANNDVDSGNKATAKTATSTTTTGARTKNNNNNSDLVLDEDKQFVCTHDNCEKRFSNKFLLKKHQFTHTGLRPHACPFCPKRFNRKDNLLRHKKTHYANGLLEKAENGGGRKRHNMLYGVTQDTVHLISTLKNAVAAAAAASGANAEDATSARIGARQQRRKAVADYGNVRAMVPEVKRMKSEE